MTPRSPARRRALVSVLALTGPLWLVACSGDDEPDDGGDAARVLEGEQATKALLTQADVGPEFRSVPGIEAVSLPGCLVALDELEAYGKPVTVEAKYQPARQPDQAVLSGVRSYDDAAGITEAFDEFQQALESCTAIAEEGVFLDVVSNDDVTADVADDQANLMVEGQVRVPRPNGKTRATPYRLEFTISRLQNNITRVASYRIGRGRPPGDLGALNAIAVERLASVMDE